MIQQICSRCKMKKDQVPTEKVEAKQRMISPSSFTGDQPTTIQTRHNTKMSEPEIRRRLGKVIEMALTAADRADHQPDTDTHLTPDTNGCTIDALQTQSAT